MDNILNRLDPDALQITTSETKSPNFYQVNGNEITWTCVDAKSATTWNTNPANHKFAQLLGIYSDGDINMHSSMIVDEQSFCELWKKSSKQDLKKAYAKAVKWRKQFS